MKKLFDSVSLFKKLNHDVVSPCQFGKSDHLPFPNSNNRSTGALQLVHSDLMGPTKTPSYSSCCYVMVINDRSEQTNPEMESNDRNRNKWENFKKNQSTVGFVSQQTDWSVERLQRKHKFD